MSIQTKGPRPAKTRTIKPKSSYTGKKVAAGDFLRLEAKMYRANVRWGIDYSQEFIDILTDDEKAFLVVFLAEFYGSAINNFVGPSQEHRPIRLHTTPEHRKDVWARGNAANRDIYSIFNSGNAIEFESPSFEDAEPILNKMSEGHPEDAWIAKMDLEMAAKKKANKKKTKGKRRFATK